MSVQEDKERAINAQRILNDPLFDEAFTTLAARLREERDTSKPEEVEKRERVHFQLQELRHLRNFFERLVSEGKLATQIEAKVKARRERLK